MQWLVFSIVASVILTVVLNVAIRLWPGAAERGAARASEWADRQPSTRLGGEGHQVRVIAPWKLMIIGSIVLTVGLNLAIRLF